MASKETWEKVKKYFRPDSRVDNWGDTDAISDEHLLKLFDFRVYIGVPIYILNGVKDSGHSKGSYHYPRVVGGKKVGFATDVVIPDYELSPFDLILDATRFGFTGIGFYPHWRYKQKVVGGLHLDSRPLGIDSDGTPNYGHSRWMGILVNNGTERKPKYKQEYVALDFANLIAYTNYGDNDERVGLH